MTAAAATKLDASATRLARVRELWTKNRADREELGRLLYEERAERLSLGGAGNREGFHQWLRDAGISKQSAYRRIAEHEILIGVRDPEDTYDKPTEKVVPVGTGSVVSVADTVPSALEPVTYQCSDCGGTFEVTADRIAPHIGTSQNEKPIVWFPPVNPPTIKGWSSMNAGEKQTAARAAGCAYCLVHNSSRSCPAHGWKEKDPNSHFNVPEPTKTAPHAAPAQPEEKPVEEVIAECVAIERRHNLCETKVIFDYEPRWFAEKAQRRWEYAITIGDDGDENDAAFTGTLTFTSFRERKDKTTLIEIFSKVKHTLTNMNLWSAEVDADMRESLKNCGCEEFCNWV